MKQAASDEWGVLRDWVDADGVARRVDEATVDRVRAAIGRPPGDLAERVPIVTRPGRRTGVVGTVVCEDGSTRDLDDLVPDDFPLGYHTLTTATGVERRLIVSPGRCWLPERQVWGWSVQLYAARSTRSLGVGDLADLRVLREWTESLGGGFLLVNPLHAVAPVLPQETSPYLPATRRFRNPLYLRLDDVPGCAPHPADGHPDQLRAIDRDAAWTFKLTALRTTYDARLADGIDGIDGDTERAYAAWRADQGRALEDFATWSVLATEHGPDWHDWPVELHDPRGAAVASVVEARRDDVGFHAWLQWLLAEQLAAATGDLTVIQDLPIGVSGGGADAWAWQGVLADAMSVGAPPDALNSVGQDWGSPPLTPWRLQEAGYEPFVESVRATIAGAGGLRIDHVMGLFRLWWIPQGLESTAGCYVRYPAEDLLDIVCLESHRAQAVVVGEDLGTVEDGVVEALSERSILSYRLLWFEDDDPREWPELSLAAVTTHDLPTVAGLWTGSDVDDQLESSDMTPADVRSGREELLARLRRGLPDGDDTAGTVSTADAVAAAYARLGQAPSLLLALSLEDAVLQERRPNVPGTVERDNWRVPLSTPVDELAERDGPTRLLAALRGDRRTPESARPVPPRRVEGNVRAPR